MRKRRRAVQSRPDGKHPQPMTAGRADHILMWVVSSHRHNIYRPVSRASRIVHNTAQHTSVYRYHECQLQHNGNAAAYSTMAACVSSIDSLDRAYTPGHECTLDSQSRVRPAQLVRTHYSVKRRSPPTSRVYLCCTPTRRQSQRPCAHCQCTACKKWT